MKGLVVKNTGFWYTVLCEDGRTIDCKVKGNFRLKGIRTTNPVAVGDNVVITTPDENRGSAGGEGTAFITEIADRRNYIIRKSQNLSKQSHILAANVDQAVLVVTVNYPETSTTFIDRFLASAEAYRVPVILAFNKTDLLTLEEQHIQQLLCDLYETVGYECIRISAATGQGVDTLLQKLKGKISVLSGNSGVGKSTLINRIIPDANLRTSEISEVHNAGMHTTTFSEMLRVSDTVPASACPDQDNLSEKATWIIDTPGIKGFGTFDMEPEEISGYFKEIFHYSRDCRFGNCTHTHEPGCAVLRAVEECLISKSRYSSYLSMLEDKEDGKYRAAY